MTKLIVSAFFTILALIGLCELIHFLKLLIKAPKKMPIRCTVIFLEKDYYTEQIDYIISERVWYGKTLAEYIIAVKPDSCIIHNEEIVEKNYNIKFCNADNVMPTINKLMD